jgi:hypothetical protein
MQGMQQGMHAAQTHRWSMIAAAVSCIVILTVFVVHTALPAAGRLTHGFMAYYVGGEVVREAGPASRLYDDPWFSARVRRESRGTASDVYLANPPSLAVAWLPLTYLTVDTARRLWIALSGLCLALALWLVADELGWSRRPWALVGLSALFTLPAPVREQFALGQMYACLLLLNVVGWRAYLRRQDAAAGAATGLALALKFSGWPIAVLMLARRRWIAVCWVLLSGAIIAALSLPWVGLAAWRVLFFEEIPHVMHWGAATLPAYQDTAGFWQHLFRFDAAFNPRPLLDAPLLASCLTLASTLAALLALLAQQRSASASFAAAVALTELLSPAAEQYHYIVLLLPLAVLWHGTWLSRNRWIGGCALAATLLIAWPLDYQSAHPWWDLLHNYPRLIGGWIAFAGLCALPTVPTSMACARSAR